MATGLQSESARAGGRPRPAQTRRPVVMAMHRAKGTEFAKVLLFGVSHGSLPIIQKEYHPLGRVAHR